MIRIIQGADVQDEKEEAGLLMAAVRMGPCCTNEQVLKIKETWSVGQWTVSWC